jgi:hypothetical protein
VGVVVLLEGIEGGDHGEEVVGVWGGGWEVGGGLGLGGWGFGEEGVLVVCVCVYVSVSVSGGVCRINNKSGMYV